MSPIPRLRSAPARNPAPTYTRFMRPFGRVAEGEATDRKNEAGIRMAAMGAPARASHDRACALGGRRYQRDAREGVHAHRGRHVVVDLEETGGHASRHLSPEDRGVLQAQ